MPDPDAPLMRGCDIAIARVAAGRQPEATIPGRRRRAGDGQKIDAGVNPATIPSSVAWVPAYNRSGDIDAGVIGPPANGEKASLARIAIAAMNK